MNNKAQVLFYGFMLGLTIIILALALATPIKDTIETARTSSELNCSNSSISNFKKAACVAVDLTLFQFIGGLIFIGGAIITAKIIFT